MSKMTMDAIMKRDHREVSQGIVTGMPGNNKDAYVCVLP
jgi:hypothetical protein